MHHIILTAAVLAAYCAYAIAATKPNGPSEELVDLKLSAMAEDPWLEYLTPLVGRSCYPAKVDGSPDYSWPCNGLARLDAECMFGPSKAQKVYEMYFPFVHNASSSAGILDEVFELDFSEMLPPSDVVACVCEPRYFELMGQCASCYAARLPERSDEFPWNTEDVLRNEWEFCYAATMKSSVSLPVWIPALLERFSVLTTVILRFRSNRTPPAFSQLCFSRTTRPCPLPPPPPPFLPPSASSAIRTLSIPFLNVLGALPLLQPTPTPSQLLTALQRQHLLPPPMPHRPATSGNQSTLLFPNPRPGRRM